jgi:hypothetical protein
MDELSTIQQLLTEPPPGPEVVEAARLKLEHVTLGRTPERTRAAAGGWHAPGLVRRATTPRRWPGWLAPVAAAAAMVGVIAASLAISGALLRPAGPGGANPSGVFANVPRFFVALPAARGHAIVAATATGAVLGTVTPPKHTIFIWTAAAGDDRTFVFAAGVPPKAGTSAFAWGPIRFYRLVLSRSGHPGPLMRLPIPAETAPISGLAVSPDGSKFAVSYLGPNQQTGSGSKIQVFSLATWAGREWVLPVKGWIGQISIGVGGTGRMSWEANNRTLLFEEGLNVKGGGWTFQLRLLDTATSGGSLQASSTLVPISGAVLGAHPVRPNLPFRIPGIPLITGDGTKLVTPTFRNEPRPNVFDFMITELSVQTGKPLRVLYRVRTGYEDDSPAVLWVNNTGTAMIAFRPRPGQSPNVGGTVLGVQTRTTFTPLPPKTQHLITRQFAGTQVMSRLPAW